MFCQFLPLIQAYIYAPLLHVNRLLSLTFFAQITLSSPLQISCSGPICWSSYCFGSHPKGRVRPTTRLPLPTSIELVCISPRRSAAEGTGYSQPSPAPKELLPVYHFVAMTLVPDGWKRASDTQWNVSLVTRAARIPSSQKLHLLNGGQIRTTCSSFCAQPHRPPSLRFSN